MRPAEPLDIPVELGLGQQLVELAIKHMPFRPRKLVMRHEQIFLPLVFPSSQRHGHAPCNSTGVASIVASQASISTGC